MAKCLLDIKKDLIDTIRHALEGEGLVANSRETLEVTDQEKAKTAISHINFKYGEQVVHSSYTSDRVVVIEPSDRLSNLYLNAYKKSQNDYFEQRDAEERARGASEEYLQDTAIVASKASPKTLARVKEFLNRIEVTIQPTAIIVHDGKLLDANALATLTENLIEVINGKEDVALSEEAMHFAVEIIEQTNPKLFNQLLNGIGRFEMYKRVVDITGNNPLYHNSDGTRNIRKLKKEAIGKVLAELYIQKNEGVTEIPDNLALSQGWWRQVVEWLRSLFTKAGFDPFEQALDIVDTTTETVANPTDVAFAQLSGKTPTITQESFIKSMLDTHQNSALIMDPSDADKSYYTHRGEKVKNRVTDLTKMKGYESTEFDNFRKNMGTKGHADIQDIVNRYVDDDGYLREKPLPQSNVSELNPSDNKFYASLEANIAERLSKYPAGTRFFAEKRIYDPKADRMGTMDLIAVTPDLQIDMFDWKFVNFSDKQKDIPASKKTSWMKQMNEYKRILTDNYGIKSTNFGKTFVVPVGATYSVDTNKLSKEKTFRLTGVKIGQVNYALEKDVKLIPVATADFRTGNKKVDELVAELNSVVSKLQKRGKGEINKIRLQPIIEDYLAAIRRLQMQKKAEDLVKIAKVTISKLQKELDSYKSTLQDPAAPTADILSLIEENRDILTVYERLDRKLMDLLKDKDLRAELASISSSAAYFKEQFEELLDLITERKGENVGVKNIKSAEAQMGALAKNFTSFSQAGTKTAKVLYKYYQDIYQKALFKFQEGAERLHKLQDKAKELAKQLGLDPIEMFKKYLIKDGNLIDQFDNSIRQKIRNSLDTKDKTVAKELVDKYVDLEKYHKWFEAEKTRRFDVIDKSTYSEDAQEDQRKKDFQKKAFVADFDLTNDSAFGTANYALLQNMNKEAWSEEYKTLTTQQVLLDLYNYQRDLNNQAEKKGMISAYDRNRFVPNVRKTYIDRVFQGGDRNVVKALMEEIRVNPIADPTFGAIDPITKESIQQIPVNFVYELSDAEKSQDFIRNLMLWEREINQFEWRSELEDIGKLLLDVEKRKDTIITNRWGSVARNPDGSVKVEPKPRTGDKNTEYLKNWMDYYIYGRKYTGDQTDVAFEIDMSKTSSRINKFFGREILPTYEDEGGKVTLSATKMVQAANRWFQMKVLGFNLATAISNLGGGLINSIINSGKYFSKGEFIRNAMTVASTKFGTEQGKIYAGLIDYFVPLLESQENEITRDLSVSRAVKILSSAHLFSIQRLSDKLVSYPLMMSFADNTMVENGELVNIREFAREKHGYLGRFKNPSDRAKIEAAIEAEIKQLQDTRSLTKISKIENDKLVIPGIERNTKAVWDFRNTVQQVTKNIMGNSTQEDMSQYRMSLLMQSFMMFKNWIPRLAQVRFRGLTENVGTDSWEYGRIRLMFSAIKENGFSSWRRLYDIAVANEQGIKAISSAYENKLQKFISKGGTEEEFISIEEFTELYYRGMRMALKEAIFWVSLAGMVTAAGVAASGDDDDDDLKAARKFTLRTLDKVKDEIGFFWNPQSALDIAGGSVFPAINTFRDGISFFKNASIDGYGFVTGNENLMKRTKTSKYFYRMFPVTKEMLNYVAIFNQDLAEDLGIRISSQYSVR